MAGQGTIALEFLEQVGYWSVVNAMNATANRQPQVVELPNRTCSISLVSDSPVLQQPSVPRCILSRHCHRHSSCGVSASCARASAPATYYSTLLWTHLQLDFPYPTMNPVAPPPKPGVELLSPHCDPHQGRHLLFPTSPQQYCLPGIDFDLASASVVFVVLCLPPPH